MEKKKRIQRVLSLFLACILMAHTPVSVLAADDVFSSGAVTFFSGSTTGEVIPEVIETDTGESISQMGEEPLPEAEISEEMLLQAEEVFSDTSEQNLFGDGSAESGETAQFGDAEPDEQSPFLKEVSDSAKAAGLYLSDLRASFNQPYTGGTDTSKHIELDGSDEYTLEIPANISGVYVGFTLSGNAPSGSTVTATYTATNGQEKTTSIQDYIPGGCIGMLPNFITAGMTGNTVTFTVGAGENIQTYKVVCTRVPALENVSFKDSEGKALTVLGDLYLVSEGMETVQVTANSYGAVLTVNGQEAQSNTAYSFAPAWDENGLCIVELKSTVGEQSTSKSYKLKLYKEGDTLSGTCGEGVVWEHTGSTLTISGTGAMAAYDGYTTVAPWSPLKSRIETIVVKSGVTSVSSSAFSQYENLKKVILEEGVKSIGQAAFSYCSALTEVTLPSGLETIGRQAFRNCGLTSIKVPASVTSMGLYAFQNCTSLESAEVMSILSQSMFAGCTSLKSITLGETVKEIPQQVFQGCAFESFVIPEGVTTIVDYAFQNCTALKSITIPSTVTELRAAQFDGCSSLTELNISGDGYKFEDSVLYSSDGTTVIMCLKDITRELVIPEGVTTIKAGVFQNKNMTSVKFPSTLTTIEANAFMGCPKLEKIELPNSVTSVGINTFSNCPALREAKLSEGMTVLSDSMFFKCAALENITLPEKLTTIGVNVFFECKSLKEMVFPANVTTMGNQVVAYCSSLTSVTLPEKLTTMGIGIFAGCTSLTSIAIPEGVSVLPDTTFSQCSALVELILPSTLTNINGQYVFNYTDALKTIYFRGSAEQWAAVTGAGKASADTREIVFYYGRTDVPVVAAQPQDTICGLNEDAVNALAVTAQKPEDGLTLSYAWYQNTEDSNKGGTLVESTVSEDGLTSYCAPKTEELGTSYYYCVLTTKKGETEIASVPSKTAKVEVIAGKWAGKGTESAPYELATAENLQTLYDFVAAGKSTAGLHFKLTADITLPDGWKPIGKMINETLGSIMDGDNIYPFSGVIDGNNRTITVPEGGLPLLGYVRGAEVKNLNIYGKQIAGYGLVNNYEGVGLSGSAIVIDNVTLKSGSSTLKSGLIGAEITESGFAGVSAAFIATIRNCTVESNVVIGYDKAQSNIGSIAGRMQGTVENCISYATVYGKDYVGGIIGCRDNAMGQCTVSDSKFHGSVEASGKYAGGISGGVYTNTSAPNGVRIAINNCTVTGNVTGTDRVGGILGGDGFTAQPWNSYTFKKNSFTGKVKATEGTAVGGIIGYYESLNICDQISSNYYSSACGAEKGIGFVKYVDTSCETHETERGALYFNTGDGVQECPEVKGCAWQLNYNRMDDPLGKDAAKLCYNDTMQEPVATELVVSGDFNTDIVTGSELDFTGMVLTVNYNDGTSVNIKKEDVTVTGFDSSKLGEQMLTIAYGSLTANINVKVMNAEDAVVKVTFTLLGDKVHDTEEDGQHHTWTAGNLETWITKTEYEFTGNATVLDILERALEEHDMTCRNEAGNYVQGITKDGVELAEFDNGKYSGWMYKLNGKDSDLSVIQQYLKDGDDLVFHYTDYYPDDSGLGNEDETEADKVADLIEKLPAKEYLKAEHQEKVEAARAAYDALGEEEKAKIPADILQKLEEAEAHMEKLLHVHTFSSWKTASKATVFQAEVQKRSCSVCEETEIRTYGKALKAVLELPGKLKSFYLQKGNSVKFAVTMARGDSIASVKSSKTQYLKVSGIAKKSGKITLKGVKAGTSTLTITLASGKTRTYKVQVTNGLVKTKKLTVNNVSNSQLTLAKGKTFVLEAGKTPFSSSQKITYQSSDKKIVSVSSTGELKALKAGKAVITVISGSKKVEVTVTVPGITNVKSKVTVKQNKTLTLKPKTYGLSGKVTYTSSNKSVAKVSSKGKITGVAPGTAVITVSRGGQKVKTTVTVPGIANVKSKVTVKKNKTLTLKPELYGISGTVTYQTSNKKIATVTSKGKIKGIKKGTAKITIKAGEFTKTVQVQVQ